MQFLTSTVDPLNRLPKESRSVINMIIKAFNSEIFSEKHLFKLNIIEYF